MIGISSSWMGVKGFSIKESVEREFELGFELVEIGAAHKYEDGAVETVLNLRKNYPNKNFTLHGLFPHSKGRHIFLNLANSKEHVTTLKIVKNMFDIGERLNVEVIGLHGGYSGEVKFGKPKLGFEEILVKKPMPIDIAKRNIIAITNELVDIAEERKIRLAIEVQPPGPAQMMTNPETFNWLFSNFKSDYFGILVDIGHLHKSSRKEGYDPYEFVKAFKDRIFEMHLHDCKESSDKIINDHIAVGTGEIDFEKYFKIIGRKTLESIPLVFEYNNSVTEQQAVNGKLLIEKLLAKV